MLELLRPLFDVREGFDPTSTNISYSSPSHRRAAFNFVHMDYEMFKWLLGTIDKLVKKNIDLENKVRDLEESLDQIYG